MLFLNQSKATLEIEGSNVHKTKVKQTLLALRPKVALIYVVLRLRYRG